MWSRFKTGILLWFMLALWTVNINLVFCHGSPYVDGQQKTCSKITCIISEEELEKTCKSCEHVGEDRRKIEEKLVKEGKTIGPHNRIADLCLLRKRDTDPIVHSAELKQLHFAEATKKLIAKYKLTSAQIQQLNELQLKGSCKKARDICLVNVFSGQCDSSSIYRTADGTCNNLHNPSWGSVGTCFNRLLPARYTGESGFRESVLGGPLPQPRDLSLNIHSHLNVPTRYVNHLYMFFGQLLDHDITQAPISVTLDNLPIECCPQSPEAHPQCAPIPIRPNDYFYSQFGIQCLNFVRSAICSTCRLGAREQINQITTYIDASFVYGNSLNETEALRTFNGGRLRVQSTSVGDLLPPSPDPEDDQCSFLNTSDICFQAGDFRVNQHTTLASLHTIFVREHNRLADGLQQINRGWNDERIFQEARKIVGAEMQAITYKEFLPDTLGRDRMNYFNLWITRNGWTNYDANVDPTLYTEFSTAAFRYGHSLINSAVTLYPRTNNNELRLLRNEFFQPFALQTGILSPLMNGVSRSPAQYFDRHLVPDVTNYLYRVRGSPAGLDLASINIHRGRDHGIPTYVEMVRECSDRNNPIVIRQFWDLVSNNLMSRNNMMLLQQNYRHVADIDLWTGILTEYYSDNAVVGPTAACIIGDQFEKLKFGDRFYFENRNQVGSFTFQQVQELRKVTLSQIICANTNIAQMPLNAMLFQSRSNPLVQCRMIRGVDLSYWRS